VLVEQHCLTLVDILLEMLELMEVIHVFLLSLLQQLVVVKVDLEILDLYQLAICQKVVHLVDQVVEQQLEIAQLLDLEQRIKVMLVDHHQVLLLQQTQVVEVVEPEVSVLDQEVQVDNPVVMV
tara:strand:+ start:577 stop:945 length:369 start_codon:yes stop_codon:yes gene_type:complete